MRVIFPTQNLFCSIENNFNVMQKLNLPAVNIFNCFCNCNEAYFVGISWNHSKDLNINLLLTTRVLGSRIRSCILIGLKLISFLNLNNRFTKNRQIIPFVSQNEQFYNASRVFFSLYRMEQQQDERGTSTVTDLTLLKLYVG